MSGGGKQQTSSTSSSSPWSGQQPYLSDIYSKAQSLYGQNIPTPYTGQRVAGTTPYQSQAQQGIADFATNMPGISQAQSYVGDVLGGGGYSDSLWENVKSRVLPAATAGFEASGRYGSGLHADTTARALTEAYAPTAANQVNTALGMVPQLSQSQLSAYGALSGAGAEQQAQQQAMINANIAQYQEGQEAPWARLGLYANALGTGGSYPSTSTTTTQPGASTLSQILGAGLGIGGLVSPFFWG